MREFEFTAVPATENVGTEVPNYYMPKSRQEEQFSIAYIQAIASASGYGLEEVKVDLDSIDVTIRQYRNTTENLYGDSLRLQLKCTFAHSPTRDHLPYPLAKKNYNDLCQHCMTPRILVVVHVPRDFDTWITLANDSMILKHHAYWCSLKGQPSITAKSKTVHLPLSQRLTVEALRQLMNMVATGGYP